MPAAAGVLYDDGNDAEVGGVPRGRLDPNFHRNANDGDRANAAVAQHDREGRAANADMVSLSKIASLVRGASSGVISKPGEPRRKQGVTFSGSSVRCQAIAMR
jgi:hypothetical protein